MCSVYNSSIRSSTYCKYDFKGTCFSFAHHNVNRLYHKLDEIRTYLHSFYPFNVYCCCETFLNNTISDQDILIEGYNVVRRDRTQCGGGWLLVYIMNNIDYTRRCDLERNDIEVIWLELIMNREKTLISFTYRSPNKDTVPFNVWLNYMEDALGTAYSENKGIILLADFNIDSLPDRNHPHVKSWTDVVSNFELEQIITQPTRITATTSTLIDHIYVNTNINIKKSDVIQWSISDHFPVYAAIENDNNLN